MMQTRPVWAEISRSNLLSNWKLLRSAAEPGSEVLAVVKANAYGHGVLPCASLLAAEGAEWLGVSCVEEGVAVRAVAPRARILTMSGLWQGEAEAAIEHKLTPQIWEPFHFELLEEAARRRNLGPQTVPVHLEIDTGMSRQGVRSLNDLKALLARYDQNSPIKIEGMMTHFHSAEMLAESATEEQVAYFAEAFDLAIAYGLRPRWIHAGNSAILLSRQATPALTALAQKHGARLMLRCGLALYGYSTRYTPALDDAQCLRGLRPVLSWKTRVVSLRTIKAAETVGYNMTFKATRDSRLALIPMGYGDGYNRLLSNRGCALVRGKKAVIAGRISMDQTVLDVTDIPGVAIGDEVVLIGEQDGASITAYDLSDVTGTIPYEVLCAIGARVPRVPID